MHARCTIISKEIITDAARSAAHIFWNPTDIRWNSTDGTTPRERNTAIGSNRLTTPVRIGGGTTGSPIRTGRKDIISLRGSIGPQWSRDAQPLDTYINGIYYEHRDPAPTWSEVIGHKFTNKSSADVNLRCRMNLTRDAVLTKIPNFMNMGLSSVPTLDELGSIFIRTTITVMPADGSNCIPPGHCIGKFTVDRVIRMGSE